MKPLKETAVIWTPSDIAKEESIARTTHLCFGAHQDDVEFMSYSAISECYGQSDKWFTAVVLTDGAGSPRSGIYGKYTDEDMKKIRIKEQTNAAILGEYAACYLLSHPSSELKVKDDAGIIDEIASIIKECHPKVVYTHNFADKHDTHVAVAVKVIKAIRTLPKEFRPEKIIGLEVWRGLDWVCDEEKLLLCTSEHPNMASALLGLYDSQITGGKRYDAATQGRWVANATYLASHAVDSYSHLSYGIDITADVFNENISIVDIITKFIDSFKAEVSTRVNKFI